VGRCNTPIQKPSKAPAFSSFSEEIKAKEDGGERIRLLQDKINEMRKLYSSLKAEVASIDRKRKRLKKKRGGIIIFVVFLFPFG